MDMNAYLSMFIDESNDHLQALNDNMLQLEGAPDDLSIVQVIFRSAHTLKGMSATMGYGDLASLTHEMENVLDLVRNGKLDMDAFIFDALFKSLDALEAMVSDISAGGEGKADVSAIVGTLKSIERGDYKSAAPQLTAEEGAASSSPAPALDEFQMSVLSQSIESGLSAYLVKVSLREDCALKAVRAYMVFKVLEENGEIVKSDPSADDLEQEKFERSFTVIVISELEQTALQERVEAVSEVERAEALQLDAEALAQLARPEVGNAPAAAGAGEALREEASRQPAAAASGAPSAARTIRVDIERLDTLMNLFSELLIEKVRLEQLAGEIRKPELTETVERMSRLTGDLQDIVLKLRMVPVESVFNRFPRMVRDLAKSLDKKVELVITGADTELDRTVIDEIGDPLVHLLRNSLDHGLETREGRIAAGKPETGTVHLRAYQSGNSVFIEVEEDGRGINSAKVKAKAIENGIVAPDEAARLTTAEINNLIFAAGFSTADQISDISGRGVGLDVVRSKIASLGGTIDVQSREGAGTKFTIQLPLTLSIISAMIIKLGSEKFALPLSSIAETGIIRRDEVLSVHGSRMIQYRNAVIPLISLGSLLDSPDYDDSAENETEMLVVRKGDKWAALLVDEFIGQSEIVLKPLGRYLAGNPIISGATILGDGQVALIVDSNAIFK